MKAVEIISKKACDVQDGRTCLSCQCGKNSEIVVALGEQKTRFTCLCGRKYDVSFNHRQIVRRRVDNISGTIILIGGRTLRVKVVDYSHKGFGLRILAVSTHHQIEIGDKFTFASNRGETQFDSHSFVVRSIRGKSIGAQFADGQILTPSQRSIMMGKK